MLFRKQNQYSDADVIKGLEAGGASGERMSQYLFDQYRGLVIKGMNRYRLSEEDSLDVYSDTIIAIGQQVRAGRFRGDSKLSTYLFKIFYNRCLNKVRDNKSRQLNLVEEMPDVPTGAQSILQSLIQQEEVGRLLEVMDQLGQRCKEILLLREYYGYSMEEIAEKIG
ncbi:MAG: sigma-70 family RNA polymerase sigma factor, partial [Bacteroidota bacterium]